MSGRYAFSLPEPRQRDGWFRIGTIDVTTTALIVGLGLISMFLYALDPETAFLGAYASDLVREGEIWRIFTWPLTNPPTIWNLIGLAFFWYFGHMIEDQMGRKPYTWLMVAMTVIPATLVAMMGTANELSDARWSAYTYSVSLLSLGLITIFGIDNPNAKFLFGIPAWVIAGAYVAIQVLSLVGVRAWAQLILMLLVIVVGCIGARQRGMVEVLSFIPVSKRLAGPTPSPYGEIGSAKPKRSKGRRRGKPAAKSSGPTVVAGPWGGTNGGITALEQAELDVLLDRISDGGIDSLTKLEKSRLQELSKRMRDS